MITLIIFSMQRRLLLFALFLEEWNYLPSDLDQSSSNGKHCTNLSPARFRLRFWLCYRKTTAIKSWAFFDLFLHCIKLSCYKRFSPDFNKMLNYLQALLLIFTDYG